MIAFNLTTPEGWTASVDVTGAGYGRNETASYGLTDAGKKVRSMVLIAGQNAMDRLPFSRFDNVCS